MTMILLIQKPFLSARVQRDFHFNPRTGFLRDKYCIPPAKLFSPSLTSLRCARDRRGPSVRGSSHQRTDCPLSAPLSSSAFSLPFTQTLHDPLMMFAPFDFTLVKEKMHSDTSQMLSLYLRLLCQLVSRQLEEGKEVRVSSSTVSGHLKSRS